MATLKMADDEMGYFRTDSSTWDAARKEIDNLKILFRGDPMLINTYHALSQPPGATAAQPADLPRSWKMTDVWQCLIRITKGCAGVPSPRRGRGTG